MSSLSHTSLVALTHRLTYVFWRRQGYFLTKGWHLRLEKRKEEAGGVRNREKGRKRASILGPANHTHDTTWQRSFSSALFTGACPTAPGLGNFSIVTSFRRASHPSDDGGTVVVAASRSHAPPFRPLPPPRIFATSSCKVADSLRPWLSDFVVNPEVRK